MRRLIAVWALLSGLAAAVAFVGGGLTLLAIENSGERGVGALLALCGAVAFAAVMVLVVAKEGAFGEGVWRAAAIAAAIVGAMPVAALAYTAIRFAGIPFGSSIPLIDWSALATGLLLGLGVIAILALGHRRSQEGTLPPPVHMQQIRHAQQQLRTAFATDQQREAVADEVDENVRVRRV